MGSTRPADPRDEGHASGQDDQVVWLSEALIPVEAIKVLAHEALHAAEYQAVRAGKRRDLGPDGSAEERARRYEALVAEGLGL